MPCANCWNYINEIKRSATGPDCGLGVDIPCRPGWSLASDHAWAVATDKRLVRVAFRSRSVSACGLVVEEMRGNQRFRLASICCRTAFLRRRSFCANHMASQLVR
jgi:hypothetical protein